MNRVILATALLFTGCSKKSSTPEPAVAAATDQTDLETPADAPASEQTAEQAVAELEKNFARVFFGFDSSALTDEALAHLEKNAKILKQHPGVRVEIHGHADERGTVDYNLALAMKRADKVRTTLETMGVDGSRLKVISFGEERPLATGARPSVFSMNRRAEFNVVLDPDGTVTGTLDDPLPSEDELIMDGPEDAPPPPM